MKSLKPPMALLLLLTSSLAVSACETPKLALQTYPPVDDLKAPPKPVPTIDILTSAAASARHSANVEVWGDGLALQIHRVCVWAKDRGMTEAPC